MLKKRIINFPYSSENCILLWLLLTESMSDDFKKQNKKNLLKVQKF